MSAGVGTYEFDPVEYQYRLAADSHKGLELPPYIQHVAEALVKGGHPESEAIKMAVGIAKHPPKNWGVQARAAAAKAAAEWEARQIVRAPIAASSGFGQHYLGV